MNSPRITIVGVGDDGPSGLSQQAIDLIQQATKVYGSTLLLERFDVGADVKQVIGPDLERLATELEKAPEGSVVLATGDPLFYGTARFLCERLGKDSFRVIPHVSSMQLAFARVKESWDEAYLTNAANQPLDRIIDRIRTAEKAGIFTSEEVPPARIAEMLIARGICYFTAYVCENLGAPNERVTKLELTELAQQRFAPMNVLVLLRHNGTPDQQNLSKQRRMFGNPDEFFKQSRPKRGLLTTSEIRSIALSEMNLRPDSIVWDIGAGSGSLAIEAAQIARQGKVYAIEMDAEDYNLLLENAKQFEVENLVGVLGEAPEAWRNLPDPHSIFVGGTGRAVVSLVQACWHRLQPGGTLLVNMMSIENVSELQQHLIRDLHLEPQLWMVQISKGTYQLEKHRFETSNPSFLMKATKPSSSSLSSVKKS